MKIMVLNGSPRQNSRSRGVTNKAAELLKQHNVEVTTFDVGKDMLPLYTGSEEDREHETVKKLSLMAEQADGFFICTPEYHNGMSGALKNALDYLGGAHFRGKPAAIAAASGGGKGGINALNNLRTVMRGVYALVLPEQFVADPQCINEHFEMEIEEDIVRLRGMTDELVVLAGLLSERKKIKAAAS